MFSGMGNSYIGSILTLDPLTPNKGGGRECQGVRGKFQKGCDTSFHMFSGMGNSYLVSILTLDPLTPIKGGGRECQRVLGVNLKNDVTTHFLCF